MNQRLHSNWLLIIFVSIASVAPSFARAEPTDAKPCEFCPYPQGIFGYVELGLSWTSDDVFTFENYRGQDEGLNGVADLSLLWIGDDSLWRATVSDGWLRARDIRIDGGKPGRYRIRAGFDESIWRGNDSGASPFIGMGSGSLSLPSGWIRSFRTDRMQTLSDSLAPIAFDIERSRVNLGLAITPKGQWSYRLDYQREQREGLSPLGGGFMFVSAALPAPIDSVTETVEAGVTYQRERWHSYLNYRGSFFDNDQRDLTWETPFLPLVPGGERGRFDLAPDSSQQSVSLGGQFNWPTSTLRGHISYGMADQNDPFLAYTINPQLRSRALPRGDLDGDVRTTDVLVRFDSRLGPGFGGDLARGLTFDAVLRSHDRDNRTPSDVFLPAPMDLYLGQPRTNLPFSYRRQTLTVAARQRLGRSRIGLGASLRQFDRDYGQRQETNEDELWADWRVRLPTNLTLHVRALAADRDGSKLLAVPDHPIENPALRKFNVADRQRRQIQTNLTATPIDWLTLGASFARADDAYQQSKLGLIASESQSRGVNVDISIRNNFNVHAFHEREDIDARVRGSASFGEPDWLGITSDELRASGLGARLRDLAGKGIELAVDYTRSESTGVYAIDGAQISGFPDLTTELEGWRLRLRYPLQRGQLTFDLYREDYRASDWHIDDVAVDSVFNYLTLGQSSPDFSVDTVAVRYRRPF